MLPALLALAVPAVSQVLPPPGGDWVLPFGTTTYQTGYLGPVRVHSMTVGLGCTLRVMGDEPFVVIAEDFIRVEGVIDARGFPAKSVITTFTPVDYPEFGAFGGPGGGKGGMGHPGRGKITAGGGRGTFSLFPEPPAAGLGGGGGETGYSPSIIGLHRRGGGGGGGAFGPDAMGSGPGLRARAGAPGHPLAIGAMSGAPLPAGGAAGGWAFLDGNPLNDFLGVKVLPTGALVHGELTRIRGGAGGGGGGQSLASDFFAPGWGPSAKWFRFFRNGGGGGGGGAVLFFAERVEVTGSQALLLVDGGEGSSGDQTYFGAASGGGSGGLLILDATTIDLRGASADVLSARGGQGKVAAGVPGAGGDGGPGLLQLHLADPATQLLLSPGTTLADLSAPDAHVLLPLHP